MCGETCEQTLRRLPRVKGAALLAARLKRHNHTLLNTLCTNRRTNRTPANNP